MKVAIITPGFLPVPAVKGGAVETLIEEIIKGNEIYKKYDIDLYTIYDEKLVEYHYNNTKIIPVKIDFFDKVYCRIYNLIHRIFNNKEDFIRSYTVKIKRLLRNKKYDMILVENNMTIVNYINHNNMIFHLHNDILDDNKPLYQCKQVIKKCQKILTVSDYIKQRLETVEKSNKIQVFYNCVDFNVFNNEIDINEIELRRKYGIGDNDFIYTYTGRMVEEKGILELSLAFERLLSSTNNVKLLLVGNNPILDKNSTVFDKKLEEVISRIRENVIYTGYVNHNDIPKILKISDVIVIPSKWEEPFGVVALEAMAMKKAIIATNSGGLIEPLNKESAVIINKENLTNELYESMRLLYDNKEKREILALNAYKRVHSLKEFNKNNYFNNFIKIINENLNER